jgi:hypothetical protein
MVRKKPNRMTVDLCLSLPPETVAKIKSSALALGLTASEYLGALSRGQTPVGMPAVENVSMRHAVNRVVRAIDLLDAEELDRPEMLRLLRAAQLFIVEEQRKLNPVYDAAIKDQGKDGSWGDLGDVAFTS